MPNGIRIVNANGNDESKSNQSSGQSRSNNSKSILNRNINPSQSITSFNDPNSMFNNNKSPSKTRSKSQPTQYQHNNNLQINYPNNANNSRSPSKSQSNSKSFRKKHKNRAKRVGSQSPGLRSQKPNNGYNFPDNNMENNNIEIKIDRKQNSLSDDDDSSNNLDQFSQDKAVLSVSDIQNPPGISFYYILLLFDYTLCTHNIHRIS